MNNRSYILIFLFLATSLLPLTLLAQTPPSKPGLTQYQLLEPLPFDNSGGLTTKTDAPSYIAGLFRLIIALAGVLAVVRLTYAGIVKASSDAISNQNKAKDIISEAIWGLLLALSAWIIVATILPTKDGGIVFDLSLPKINSTENNNYPGAGGSCADCVPITVAHKEAPTGCKAPGPCQISATLDTKLVALNKLEPGKLLVSESYPPTEQHKDPCHAAGSCVDITTTSRAAADITRIINNARKIGLSATYEVTTRERFDELAKAGVPQVLLNKDASGEHFHIK